jgi:hypothetical protein
VDSGLSRRSGKLVGVCKLFFPPRGGFHGEHFVVEEEGHRVPGSTLVSVVTGESQPVGQMPTANLGCAPNSAVLDVAGSREVEGCTGMTHLDFLAVGIGDVGE